MHMKCLKVPAICTAHSLTLQSAYVYVQSTRSRLGVNSSKLKPKSNSFLLWLLYLFLAQKHQGVLSIPAIVIEVGACLHLERRGHCCQSQHRVKSGPFLQSALHETLPHAPQSFQLAITQKQKGIIGIDALSLKGQGIKEKKGWGREKGKKAKKAEMISLHAMAHK